MGLIAQNAFMRERNHLHPKLCHVLSACRIFICDMQSWTQEKKQGNKIKYLQVQVFIWDRVKFASKLEKKVLILLQRTSVNWPSVKLLKSSVFILLSPIFDMFTLLLQTDDMSFVVTPCVTVCPRNIHSCL